MEHIYEPIPGWFSFDKFYTEMVNKFPSGAKFVEVGTYKGRSFSYLVVEVINSGKEIECIGIDACPWPDVEPEFNQYMKPLEGHFKTIFGGDSFDRAKDFENESIDFIFIDACHVYEFVYKDIINYLPKMKKGAIMAGHDMNEHHPGVVMAVSEIFPEKFNYIKEQDVWWVQL